MKAQYLSLLLFLFTIGCSHQLANKADTGHQQFTRPVPSPSPKKEKLTVSQIYGLMRKDPSKARELYQLLVDEYPGFTKNMVPRKYRSQIKRKVKARTYPRRIYEKKSEPDRPYHIEAEQVSSYFCMKHERAPKFRQNNSCKTYSQSVYQYCLRQTQGLINRSLVRCLKSNLLAN